MLSRKDERRGLKDIHILLLVVVALLSVYLLTAKQGPTEADKSLLRTCGEWYSSAHTRRDTLLADNRTPQPRLQPGRAYSCGQLFGYH